MTYKPIRLQPGSDLRRELERAAGGIAPASAFVISGIGSLTEARLRFAGAETECVLRGPLEVLTLSGSISADGAHLHMSLADHKGRVYGGHACYGNEVATTAEILLAPVVGWDLSREYDEDTGYQELSVQPSGDS